MATEGPTWPWRTMAQRMSRCCSVTGGRVRTQDRLRGRNVAHLGRPRGPERRWRQRPVWWRTMAHNTASVLLALERGADDPVCRVQSGGAGSVAHADGERGRWPRLGAERPPARRFFDGTTLLGTSPVSGGVSGTPPCSRRIWGVGRFRRFTAATANSSAASRSLSVSSCGGDGGGLDRRRRRCLERPGPAGAPQVQSQRVRFPALGHLIVSYQVFRRGVVAAALTSAGISREARAAARGGAGGRSRPGSRSCLGGGLGLRADGSRHDRRRLRDGCAHPGRLERHGASSRGAVQCERRRARPEVCCDSPPDSGYSADNLPPVPPAPFVGTMRAVPPTCIGAPTPSPTSGTTTFYRGGSAGFVPGPGSLIATRGDTGYVDPGPAGAVL